MRVLVPDLDPHAFVMRDPAAAIAALDGATMGTCWRVRLVERPGFDIARIRAEIEMVLDRVIDEMSPWEAQSAISRFNRAPANSWHDLPSDFATVLRAALDIAADSGGAFDPSAGALVDLWGFGPVPVPATVPDAGAIAAARARTGWQALQFDRAARRLRQPGGIRLDLSGIAKGFAVDQLAARLAAAGVRDFLVEIGGELRGEGVKPDGQPWWVALEIPPGLALPRTRIALHGLSVATSGDYRRRFCEWDATYAHTIDPRTGRPAATGLASVSVVHRSCMLADAYATALIVLGEDAGHAFAERHGVAALFVVRTADGARERMTPALASLA